MNAVFYFCKELIKEEADTMGENAACWIICIMTVTP